MNRLERLKRDWLQPFFYFGNNPTTLIGSGLTTAAAVTLIFYWIASMMTGTFRNPYLGLIFFLGLPALFILGLILIPTGMWRQAQSAASHRAACLRPIRNSILATRSFDMESSLCLSQPR